MTVISNQHIAFRVPDQIKDRLTNMADYEMLSISDVCRRSVIQTIKEHESLHPADTRTSSWSV
jgi:hypothetical protein